MRSFQVDSPDDVDRLALELTESITRALEASRLSTTSHRKRPQLPAGIRDMIEDKRRLRRLYQRTRCPTIKSQLNALAERVSAVLEDHAVDSWYKTIERAREDWTGIHRICRQESRKSEPIRPLLASDGTPRYRAADRAEIFADHLERPTEDTQHAEEVEQTVDEYLEQAIAPTEDPIIITPGQVFSRFAVLSSGRPRVAKRKPPRAPDCYQSLTDHGPGGRVAAGPGGLSSRDPRRVGAVGTGHGKDNGQRFASDLDRTTTVVSSDQEEQTTVTTRVHTTSGSEMEAEETRSAFFAGGTTASFKPFRKRPLRRESEGSSSGGSAKSSLVKRGRGEDG
ncbi:unnamed protein product [Danaus chrysippus]|uniref:(African queen) hypothetical protein n=1 Tax=Danaus chrysippus TaxID=151541 RepID=A0A8J2QY97_9NEOP|nr:unnamed protein product [Danaus chrysippus]